MTESQADQVYDLACEKYIEESRALDRYNDEKALKIEQMRSQGLKKASSKNPIDKIKGHMLINKAEKEDHTYTQPMYVNKYNNKTGKYEPSVYDKRGGSRLMHYDHSNAGKPMNSDRYTHDIIDIKDKKSGKYKRYDMTPAEEKKAGKYLDMYNKKKEEQKKKAIINPDAKVIPNKTTGTK